jgi:hypothetical protein
MTDDLDQEPSTDASAEALTTPPLDAATPAAVCVDTPIAGGSGGGCDIKGDKELPPGERERPAAAAHKPS